MGFGVHSSEMVSDGQWWVKLSEEAPLKCAIVGSEVVGSTKFVRGQGQVRAGKDEGGTQKFAVNAWDGKRCRVLTGSKGLYNKLLKLDKDTAGLQHIWVEVFKGPDSFYDVKYAGELSDEDRKNIEDADLEDLSYRCQWADDADSPI